MSSLFDAYDKPVSSLIDFYQRLNQPVTYPDGMTTTLGIIYWGRDDHLAEIGGAIPKFVENGIAKFSQVLRTIQTPARSTKFSEKTGIPVSILRVLKHDIDIWLPKAVALDEFEWFQNHPDCLHACLQIGLADQLAVISGGQTPEQRARIAGETGLSTGAVDEMVKMCDYYRTGKNLGHIRARIYYDMGMDTLEKWTRQTSEEIIAKFAEYIKEKGIEEERLVPWHKEVRNGIEWARLHLEVFATQW